jgi:ribosomal-protein-alanine N-acetyltransferase
VFADRSAARRTWRCSRPARPFDECQAHHAIVVPCLEPPAPLPHRDRDSQRGRGAFRRRIKRYQKETRQDSAYVFFVLRESDDALLGGCTLSNVRRGVTQCCTLGYWIGARFARQGYMTGAVKALVPFIFKTLGLHRIEAACLTDNDASKSLLARTGFRQEGIARRYLLINGVWADHLLYALLKEDAQLG